MPCRGSSPRVPPISAPFRPIYHHHSSLHKLFHNWFRPSLPIFLYLLIENNLEVNYWNCWLDTFQFFFFFFQNICTSCCFEKWEYYFVQDKLKIKRIIFFPKVNLDNLDQTANRFLLFCIICDIPWTPNRARYVERRIQTRSREKFEEPLVYCKWRRDSCKKEIKKVNFWKTWIDSLTIIYPVLQVF